jgi:superfamily I DNA/RNA helicase
VPCDARVPLEPPPPAAAEPGVVVMTMHAAKGSEFPVVFIAGVDDGTLPHDHAAGGRPGAWPSAVQEARIAEERRLLYVAVTRAIDRVALSYPAHRRQGDRRAATALSRFLDDLPAHLLRRSQQPWEV